MGLSVVMPAHNEEAYLAAAVRTVVDGLRARAWTFDVIVCENGSTDATAALADGLAEAEPEVRALHLPAADYGAALRSGFRAATGDIVANVDVDLVDLAFLDRAAAVLAERPTVAVVVGTKRGAGAVDERSLLRRAVTGGFAAVMRHGFGLRASDTHGLKMLRRDVLGPVVDACTSASEIFDTELVLRAERAGLEVAELPLRVAEQRPARTPITSRIPRTLVGLARLRRALWLEAVPGYSPSGRRSSTRKLPRPAPSSSTQRPDASASQYSS